MHFSSENLGFIWLEKWKSEMIENGEWMKKWEDRRDFNFIICDWLERWKSRGIKFFLFG